MPHNRDPIPAAADPTIGDRCPKCGLKMEPIDIDVEGLALQELQLCPGCYLVTWTDENGPHARQGVPMKAGENPGLEPNAGDSGWLSREPEEC